MSSLAAEERQDWLLAELRSSKTVSLTDAANALGVSEMTVRRDLDYMQELGIARRVRGGAVYGGPVNFEGRERSHATEKAAIAEKLISLVPESGVIALDSSTTMHRLAQLITGNGNLTVVTNGLSTFQALRDRPGITPILTGGAGDNRTDSLIGPVATASIDSMRFSILFASAAAIDLRGSYEDTLEEAEIKRAFARSSARVIVGAHSDKLDGDATAASIPLERVITLATELEPSRHRFAPYRDVIADLR